MEYQATIPATILAEKINVRPSNPIINKETTYDFSAIFPLPLPVGSVIVISIPSSISINSKNGNLIMNSAEGSAPLYKAI